MMRWYLAAILLFAVLLPTAQGAQTCPAALHDAYKAQGPDGAWYPTWHPPVDPVSGCVFGHEHGSNPALFRPSFKPLYGYSAQMMSEGHAGFKGIAFQVEGVRWYITLHQGTANAAMAACNRFHTFDLALASDTALLADTHDMADFGRAEQNVGATPLQTACTDQVSQGRAGVRQFPTESTGAIGYEPWMAASTLPGVFLSGFTVNVKNPQTGCDTLTCTVALARLDQAAPALGTWREVSANPGLGVTSVLSGTFSVSVHGASLQQYIKPGLNIRLASQLRCKAFDAFAYSYDCTGALWDETPFRRAFYVTGAN